MKIKLVAAFAAVLLIAAAAVALVAHSSKERGDAVAARAGDRDTDREGKYGADPRKERAFERAIGEADRKGPSNPVIEQVENRAYPRSYVDDRLALKARQTYARTARAARRHSRGRARAAADSSWTPLGPTTPWVTGEASQFLDPNNTTDADRYITQESGRVTAMAIDPNCGRVADNCRLWVAAAGGGIWRTPNALAGTPDWIAPPAALDTNAFGSLIVDPTVASGDTLYAGSGEPNGSGDSEAGLGLYKSTDGGASWDLVPGSRTVAIDRSIGSIAITTDAQNRKVIYIGTDVARHGSSSANGGRRTPPNAPRLGVYKSVGGGPFELQTELSDKTPSSPVDPAEGTGVDWFQGSVNKIELDPNNPQTVYAAVVGYGLWRSTDGGTHWAQVFHTYNQTNFDDAKHPGDTYGDRTEFDAVAVNGKTRIYLGDSSDDLLHAWVWRTDDAGAVGSSADGHADNSGWTQLSSSVNGTTGFGAYDYCQNGQCGYDDFVASPPSRPNDLWLGGSMNYDELPLYGALPPRSNGRAVVRSRNAGAAPDVASWQDMTATIASDGKIGEGIHPDLHAIVFDPQHPDVAFIGSDGGVVKIDVTSPQNKSAVCDNRTWTGYTPAKPQPLAPADLADCRMLLSGIPTEVKTLNDGLNDLQFQSLSVFPGTNLLMGGTQDNGTFAVRSDSGSGLDWFESVGGDGGQSGFDKSGSDIRYHNYYDATPEVNFEGDNPQTWLDIYDPLQASKEDRSFYVPFITDPQTAGRAFIGMGHVWRTDDNGGNRAWLEAHCNALRLDPTRNAPCGDWKPLGDDLSSTKFGQSRAGEFVVATERAPGDEGTLWAGTRIGRLFITKNANAANPRNVNFVRIDDDDAKAPGRFVSGIAVDPGDPNHAWVSYSGYGAYTPDTKGHVFEVTYDPKTKKATFVDLDPSNALPDAPVTGIAHYGSTTYIANDFGVMKSASGGSWVPAADGMPAVAVYGLTLDRTAGHPTLYAATHGRGAYKLGL